MTEAVDIGDAHTRVRLHSVEDPYQDGYQFRNFIVDIAASGITATSSVTNTVSSTRETLHEWAKRDAAVVEHLCHMGLSPVGVDGFEPPTSSL